MSATTYSRSWFFQTPDKPGYDRFSTQNKPSKLTFKRFADSVLFKNEDGDTATESLNGHVRMAAAAEIQAQASSGNVSKAVKPEYLPSVIGDHSSGYTEVSNTEHNGLKIYKVKHDSSGRLDYSLAIKANTSFFEFDSNKDLVPRGASNVGNSMYWGTNATGVPGFYSLSSITGISDEKVKVENDSAAAYLSSSFFVRDTVIKPKIAENKIWVGDASGYAAETTPNTAFNKNFGYAPGDVVEIGTSLSATTFVLTDANKKLTTRGIAIGDLPTGTTSSTVALGDHAHSGVYVPVGSGAGTKVLYDDNVWRTPATLANDHKVKASSGDGTEGYLDAKINTSFFEISSNAISLKDYGITEDKLYYSIARYATLEVSPADIVQLYSNPKLVVTCPTISGKLVTIEVISFSASLAYAASAYTTNTTLALKTNTASIPQMTEANALLSTVTRRLKGKVTEPATAAETQMVAGQDLYLTVLNGNPSHSTSGGTLTIEVYYRFIIETAP